MNASFCVEFSLLAFAIWALGQAVNNAAEINDATHKIHTEKTENGKMPAGKKCGTFMRASGSYISTTYLYSALQNQ